MILQFKDEYRWLSNFWLSVVVYEGIEYPSVENAYQSSKTLDLEHRKYFETCTSGQAKRRGKELNIRSDWDTIKLSIMEDLLIQKFKHPELRQKLIDTGNQKIREGNNWNDRFWGVCLKTGLGENHLGYLIVKIRDRINDK